MNCLLCGHDNRPEARFCGGCGQSLALTCAACGHANPPGHRFCDACGATLGAAPVGGTGPAGARTDTPRSYTPAHLAQKILTSRSALEGERKQVTVLFCDLANSTEMARRIGAERMHETLNAFFEMALGEVHAVEGTINQFLGDGFMALFGAPVAHEDHLRRALTCALAIRHRLEAAAAADPDTAAGALGGVSIRMGINTGAVVVGKIGDNLRMDYTAIGDTTNVAARLQGVAKPGEVCVSEAVARQARAYFEFRPAGRHALKGIAEPVAVQTLQRAAASGSSQGSAARSLGIMSPLVGRAQELAGCAAALAEVAQGQGGALVIVGEPGTGKSRLVAELRRSATSQPLRWLEGRALSFGRQLSYWPFIGVLKSTFGIEDDDSDAEGWTKLERGMQTLFGERSGELLPYVATVLALRVPPPHEERVKYLDGPGLKRQVFLSMRQLFEALALQQPLLLLLEDWHWADLSSVELAEHLLPLAARVPLLLAFPTRPEPAVAIDRLRGALAALPELRMRELRLMPLNAAQSAELVGNLVGTELPASLREQILRRTEGNPFFIEEVIRTLVTDGALVRDARGGGWHLTREVDQIHLPETLQGLILARIDRLDDEVKQSLKLASVIGRSFFDRVLARIVEAKLKLPAQLAELEQVELIRGKVDVPEPEHIFKHALVQEAAYGSILAETRRSVHRRVAESIESLFADRADEFTSLLAHHYSCAEDWDKAQEYLFKAGDQAGRMAADAEALEHFRAAEAAYLKAHGDRLTPLQRASLARKVGVALYGTGHYLQSHAQMRTALAHLGLIYPESRGGVRRAVLRALGGHLWRRMRRGLGWPAPRDTDTAVATEMTTILHVMSWMDYFLDKERMLLDSLLELQVGETSSVALAEARGLSSVAFGCMTFDLRRRSRGLHAEAVAVAQRSGHPVAIGFAWFALAFLDFYEGAWDEFESRVGKAITAYRDAGDIHRWAAAVLMSAFVVHSRGDLATLHSMTADLVRAGRDAKHPQVESWGRQQQAYAQLAQGPLDEAEASLRIGIEIAERIPAWDNLLYQQSLLARCLVLQGELAKARAVVDESQRVIRREKFRLPFDLVEPLCGRATVLLAQAEQATPAERAAALAAAGKACDEALACARKQPLWLPQALRLKGEAAWLGGDAAAAERAWNESLMIAEGAAFPLERARTLAQMGRRMGDAGQLEQAAETLRQIGARTDHALALWHLAELRQRSGGDLAATRQDMGLAIAALTEVRARGALVLAHRRIAQLPGQSAETVQLSSSQPKERAAA